MVGEGKYFQEGNLQRGEEREEIIYGAPIRRGEVNDNVVLFDAAYFTDELLAGNRGEAVNIVAFFNSMNDAIAMNERYKSVCEQGVSILNKADDIATLVTD